MKQGQQLGIMKAMDFSDKDLDANRSGIISDSQRRKLRRGQIVDAFFFWFVAFLATLPLIFPNRWFPATDTNQLTMLGIIVLSVAMAFWQQHRTGRVLKANEVAYVTGAIKTSKRRENNHKVYRAIVGEKKFKITQDVYDWLLEGSVYTLYYLPQSNALLSIELTLSAEEKQRLEDENKLAEKKKRLAEPEASSAEMLNVEDAETGYLSR